MSTQIIYSILRFDKKFHRNEILKDSFYFNFRDILYDIQFIILFASTTLVYKM